MMKQREQALSPILSSIKASERAGESERGGRESSGRITLLSCSRSAPRAEGSGETMKEERSFAKILTSELSILDLFSTGNNVFCEEKIRTRLIRDNVKGVRIG